MSTVILLVAMIAMLTFCAVAARFFRHVPARSA